MGSVVRVVSVINVGSSVVNVVSAPKSTCTGWEVATYHKTPRTTLLLDIPHLLCVTHILHDHTYAIHCTRLTYSTYHCAQAYWRRNW